jgi:hypothetical protein
MKASIAAAFALLGMIVFAGCSNQPAAPPPLASASQPGSTGKSAEHGHQPGQHGGLIAEFGMDRYHAEVVFEKGGVVKVYTLGKETTTVQEVDQQTLSAHVQTEEGGESLPVELQAQPQPGDPPGKTSLFVGKLPPDTAGKPLTLAGQIRVDGQRYRFRVEARAADHGEESSPMPRPPDAVKLKELYSTPGGKYTAEDIAVNGTLPAKDKFRGIVSKHNARPAVGERICPISMTKANPQFAWIVSGKVYQFCCPPCIDEFIRMAKETPEEILEPEEYFKK